MVVNVLSQPGHSQRKGSGLTRPSTSFGWPWSDDARTDPRLSSLTLVPNVKSVERGGSPQDLLSPLSWPFYTIV